MVLLIILYKYLPEEVLLIQTCKLEVEAQMRGLVFYFLKLSYTKIQGTSTLDKPIAILYWSIQNNVISSTTSRFSNRLTWFTYQEGISSSAVFLRSWSPNLSHQLSQYLPHSMISKRFSPLGLI